MVDGFPLVCSTKTVAKGARTTVLLAMKIMFLNADASQSMLGSPRISLSYVLRLRMEIVRPQNANVRSEFYWHEIFHEGVILEIFLKKLKILKFLKRR